MLSIIIPAFNEHENILHTAQVIKGIMDKNNITAEIIFVDDGSSDNSWSIIEGLAQDDKTFRGLHFSRNFGKEGAIFAGLRACKGECTAVIDCDLQHPPELLVTMYQEWEKGAEVVEAVKASRGKEGLFYKIFAKTFYKMMKSSSGINMDGASDYKLMDRKVVNALNSMPERLTFFRALSSWVGFNTVQVPFEVAPRSAGKSKFNFKKLFKFALNNLTSFSNIPVQIVTFSGIIFFIIAVVLGIQTLVNFFMGNALGGFSTVILLLLLIGSILMLGMGILGYYISKIYEEIKFRPRYIVSIDTDKDADKKVQ